MGKVVFKLSEDECLALSLALGFIRTPARSAEFFRWLDGFMTSGGRGPITADRRSQVAAFLASADAKLAAALAEIPE